jgi:hypothetical protein
MLFSSWAIKKKGLSTNISQVADEVDLLPQSMTIIYSLSAAVKQSNKQAHDQLSIKRIKSKSSAMSRVFM